MLTRTFLATIVIPLIAMPWSSQAATNCKVKVNKNNGVIEVSAKNLGGPLLWGESSGNETNGFFDPACMTGSQATKCTLDNPATLAAATPPAGCTLYLDDGAQACSVWIRGCVPGVRSVDPVNLGDFFAPIGTTKTDNLLVVDSTSFVQLQSRAITVPTSGYVTAIASAQFICASCAPANPAADIAVTLCIDNPACASGPSGVYAMPFVDSLDERELFSWHETFSVGAGTHTVHFLGKVGQVIDAVNVQQRSLTLLFTPD